MSLELYLLSSKVSAQSHEKVRQDPYQAAGLAFVLDFDDAVVLLCTLY